MKQKLRQRGQGMVEYVVVLVFGVMALVIGPGGDVMLDLLGVMNDRYQGYSYTASLSTLPQYDTMADYLIATDQAEVIEPADLFDALENYTSVPSFELPDTSELDAASIVSRITDEALDFF